MSVVDLYWWRDAPNFGDALSQSVTEWASGRPVRHVEKERSPKLLAVGSILHYARSGDTVWGSGMHPWAFHRYLKPMDSPPDIDILAIRGPLSRDAMLTAGIPCPEVFGDPAILLPHVYRGSIRKTKGIGLVPHLKERAVYADRTFIDVGQDWRDVVDRITKCETIVSSSLHGIIVAESYGVPAVWLRSSTHEGALKFHDYYLSTGRAATPIYDVEAAFSAQPPPLPDLWQMQQGLLRAISDWMHR